MKIRVDLKKIFFVTMVLVLFSSIANACSCGQMSIEKEIDNTESIFIGQVLYIKKPQIPMEVNKDNPREIEDIFVIFNVKKNFKGSAKNQKYKLQHNYNCTYDFQSGEDYLVFANIDGNEITVAKCSLTRKLSSGDIQLIEIISKLSEE